MALHFAPAAIPGGSPALRPVSKSAAKAMRGRAIERVANDNYGVSDAPHAGQSTNDEMLRAALRHFAKHGIGAARDARAQAQQAFFDGDRKNYNWWLSVTRTLDRRLAEEAERMPAEEART